MKNHLSKSQESFCENIGLAGVLLSLTCLVQNFVIMNDHWFGFALIAIYSISVVSYVLLMKKHHFATNLLWISAVLMLVTELVTMQVLFSLVLVMLLAYLLVTIYLLYGFFIPKVLKQKYVAEKTDDENWAGKI